MVDAPSKQQHQATLHECFAFDSSSTKVIRSNESFAAPRQNRKRNRSFDDDDDDSSVELVKAFRIGTKERPVRLDDDTVSSSSDHSSDNIKHIAKRIKTTTPRNQSSTPHNLPRKYITLDQDDDDSTSTAHSHPENYVVLDQDDDDSSDGQSIDSCVREVEEYEGSKLKFAGPYSFEEFDSMWKKVETNLGETTEGIEKGRLIRGANSKFAAEDSNVQSMAQYGRLLPFATDKLFREVFDLKETDVFLDFGHGIGNACLQAAYTIGCEARGIEVVPDRHLVAQQFSSDLSHLNTKKFQNDSIKHAIGKVDLRLGSLEAIPHRKFLTVGVTAAFANNFNGVFRERSSKKPQLQFLDDYLAGLFALMSPGARLVSLHPIPLCLSKSDANRQRGRFGWPDSNNASFFELEEHNLDEARNSVSWSEGGGNKRMIKLFKYVRTQQSGDRSVFLCCNHKCDKARNAVPIDATVVGSDGRVVLNRCTCGFEASNLRSRATKK